MNGSCSPTSSAAFRATASMLGIVMGLAACSDDPSAAPEPQQVTTTSTTILSIPEDEGPILRAGTYRVSSEGRYDGPEAPPLLWSIVDFTITIPEGWNGHSGHYLSKYEGVEDAPEGHTLGFYPVLVDEIYADPCEGERGQTIAVGPAVNELVDALHAQPGNGATEPVDTTIGGLPATRIDLEVPKGADLSSCLLADYGPPGLQIWFSDASDKYLVLPPGSVASVYVVDVDGRRQVFLTMRSSAAPDEVLRELQTMLDSIRIV